MIAIAHENRLEDLLGIHPPPQPKRRPARKRPERMSKQALADALAQSLNLLLDLKASASGREEWDEYQQTAMLNLIAALPAKARSVFLAALVWETGDELTGRDLT